MSSPSKSPTPSPKNSPRIKHLPFPPLPHSSSSGSSSSSSGKTPSPLNPSGSRIRSAPLSSSPDESGIHYRLRIDSTGSTVRSPSPSRVETLSRSLTPNPVQRGRSHSPPRERVASLSRGSDSNAPELGDSWWGSRELLARPWHEPLKRRKTIPPEQTERWEITRKVYGPPHVTMFVR